jgi:hypothetical protein
LLVQRDDALKLVQVGFNLPSAFAGSDGGAFPVSSPLLPAIDHEPEEHAHHDEQRLEEEPRYLAPNSREARRAESLF